MLQHGWPQHWWEWRKLIAPLAERYRVICPDLRGFGWSEAPGGGYGKVRLARDLIGVLDALGLDRVRLAGHDWGAFAGFLACLDEPQRISRFVALSMPPPWPPAEPVGARELARGWYQLVLSAPVVSRQLLQRLGLAERLLERSCPAGGWSDEELAVYGERFRDPGRARATVSLYRTFLLRELRPLLAGAHGRRRLRVPTLVLIGEDDPLFRGTALGGYERNADALELERVAGAGHWLPEEVPGVVLERMLRFFDGRSGDRL